MIHVSCISALTYPQTTNSWMDTFHDGAVPHGPLHTSWGSQRAFLGRSRTQMVGKWVVGGSESPRTVAWEGSSASTAILRGPNTVVAL